MAYRPPNTCRTLIGRLAAPFREQRAAGEHHLVHGDAFHLLVPWGAAAINDAWDAAVGATADREQSGPAQLAPTSPTTARCCVPRSSGELLVICETHLITVVSNDWRYESCWHRHTPAASPSDPDPASIAGTAEADVKAGLPQETSCCCKWVNERRQRW